MSASGHSKVILGTTAIVLFAAATVVYLQSSRVEPSSIDGPKLVEAAHAYWRDHPQSAEDRRQPVEVDALTAAGYLTTEDVRGFQGAEVTMFRNADERYVDAVVIQAAFKDGTVIEVTEGGGVRRRQ